MTTSLLLCRNLLNPISNANTLTQEVKDYGSYKNWLASLTLEDHQYVLCLYTGDNAKFYPVEYLLISKESNSVEVQLLCGPGSQNVIQLKGKDAEAYLAQIDINLDSLNEAIR